MDARLYPAARSATAQPRSQTAPINPPVSKVPNPGNRGNIALISVDVDPAVAIGREALGAKNVYVRQLGEALARQGWQVDLFTRRTDPDQAQIVEHSPRCRSIRLTAGPESNIPRDRLYDSLPNFVEAFLEFQIRFRVQYALVHSNGWLSSWVAMALGKQQLFKHVHTYHSFGLSQYDAGNSQLMSPTENGSTINSPVNPSTSLSPTLLRQRLEVEKISLENSDRVIATSPQEQDYLRRHVSHQGEIDIIPCGVDLNIFGTLDRATARQQLKFTPEQKLVLYAGRFEARKGLETLVRAMASSAMTTHQDSLLLIAGGSTPGQADGEERDRIASLIQDQGLTGQVRFLGRLDHASLNSYYAAADLCCLPSYYEPFGLAALEAMACRTPVVASAVGGLNFTVLPQKTGVLVQPGNVQALGQAIAELLSDRSKTAEMGLASRARVEAKFNWDGVAEDLSQVYRHLLQDLQAEFFNNHGLAVQTA